MFKLVLALGLLFASIGATNAQTYPDRVVKIVIVTCPVLSDQF